jgi:NAD-dependent dihydropyrimidine dehydrogenase PreA subunit
MLTLFFSGTGNSRYVAMHFSSLMQADCHSIEENIDFGTLLSQHETICFCYPVYGSCVPRIMREFVTAHRMALTGKKLVLFCTQLLFSGDGARVFMDLLDGVRCEVAYAEHIRMPNNICNVFLFPVKTAERCDDVFAAADRSLRRAVDNIRAGRMVKRGFNPLSRLVGFLTQRVYFPAVEARARSTVRVSADCTVCGLCVQLCPMKNLRVEPAPAHEGPSGQEPGKRVHIAQNGNCTLCYRCVNQCPQKAITVMLHAKVRQQYQVGVRHRHME